MKMRSWPEVAMFATFLTAGIVSAIFVGKEWAALLLTAAAGVVFDVGAFHWPTAQDREEIDVDVDSGVP